MKQFKKLDGSVDSSPPSSLESTAVDTSGGSKNSTPDKECELSPLKGKKRKLSESSVEDDLETTAKKSIDENEGKPAPKRPSLSPPPTEYNAQKSKEEESFNSSYSSIVSNKCGTDCCCPDTSTLNCSCISSSDSPPPTTK